MIARENGTSKTLLIIDDQEESRRALHLALHDRYAICEAHDGTSAMQTLAERAIDLVLLDLHLDPWDSSPEDGMRVYRHVRAQDQTLPVIVVTGDRDRHLAIEMTRLGVNAFLQKPVDPHQLEVAVERALASASSERALVNLQSTSDLERGFGGLVASSPETRRVFAVLRRLAATTTTILLLGESGTGKNAYAEAIHRESARAGRPFVRLDVTAAPDGLIESELFGHTRGAFTGAGSDRDGRIRQAEGGTLFLDEIGNVPLRVQSKLLGFLDTRTYSPVGGNEERYADVRLIAATNCDLEEMTARGGFREDLMYRLLVATVEIQPLRRRPDEIPTLAAHFLDELSRNLGLQPPRLRAETVSFLQEQPWPGNVRQLRSVLETTLLLLDGDEIGVEHIRMARLGRGEGETPEMSRSAPSESVPAGDLPFAGETIDARAGFKEQVASFERTLLNRALEATHGNKAAAGRLLGLDDNQIRYYCRKHAL